MQQALEIMLITAGVAAVTGFLVSFMIQALCRMVRLREPRGGNDAEFAALAIAVAVERHRKRG